MNRRDRYALSGAIIIMAAVAILWLAPAGLGQAPAVTLKTLKGDAVELADLRGKPVLVTFWATTCPGCMKEIPHLVELHQDFHARGLSIFGVAMSYDPPNQVVEFTEARGLPYRIALDIEGKVAQAFGDVMLTPTTFLIAPDGRIVMHKIGQFDTGKVRSMIKSMLNQPVSADTGKPAVSRALVSRRDAKARSEYLTFNPLRTQRLCEINISGLIECSG